MPDLDPGQEREAPRPDDGVDRALSHLGRLRDEEYARRTAAEAELEQTDGMLAVAVREATRCRDALRQARPIVARRAQAEGWDMAAGAALEAIDHALSEQP